MTRPRIRSLALASLTIGLAGCGGDPEPRQEPAADAPASQPAEQEQVHPNAMLAEGDALFRERRYAEARERYEAASTVAARQGNTTAQVQGLAMTARMCTLTDRLAEGERYLAMAGGLASEEDPVAWTRYLGVRGVFERERGEPEEALKTFSDLYAYAMAHGLPQRAIDAAHHAALVAPPAEQVTWARKGIDAAKEADEEGWLAVLWNNLGTTYEGRADWKSAAHAYRWARYYHHRTGGEREKLLADWAYGRASVRAGDLAPARKLLPSCLTRARAAHEQDADDKETREWVGWTLAAHGELQVAEGEVEAGLAEMRQGREHLVAVGIEEWWPEGLSALDARIEEAAEE